MLYNWLRLNLYLAGFLKCRLLQLLHLGLLHSLIGGVYLLLLLLSKALPFQLLLKHLLEQFLRDQSRMPLILILNLIQGLHELHLPLGVIRLILQRLHRVALLLIELQLSQQLFGLLGIPVRVVVPRAAGFDDVVMVFGVCFECDLGVAVRAFQIEAEDLYAEVHLVVADLHTHVELCADVQVV